MLPLPTRSIPPVCLPAPLTRPPPTWSLLPQRMGVQAVMLSGDQPATAHAMAEAVGIPPQQVGGGLWGC